MSKNVFPTNALEEGGSSNINTHGGVVEIGTAGIPSNREWRIKRKVEASEIRNGKLKFYYHETLDDVYTSLGGTERVKSPESVSVLLYDVTEDPAVEYETSLLKAPSSEPFGLRWGAFIRDRRVDLKDENEIELSCDASGTFRLKLLRRA